MCALLEEKQKYNNSPRSNKKTPIALANIFDTFEKQFNSNYAPGTYSLPLDVALRGTRINPDHNIKISCGVVWQ